MVIAPAITIVPLGDDQALHAATEACVGLAPDIVVATTGIGFRGWLEAAEGWGMGDTLRAALSRARLIARGAKPCGAIRAADLSEDWSAPSESCEEILERLLAQGIAGRRIAVQLHGGPQAEFVAGLRAAGAAVVEVPVYRWTLPPDVAPVRRLVGQLAASQVDAVTFTSAPAVQALLEIAGDDAADVLDRFRTGTMAACVGPVTAASLVERDIPVVTPHRSRLGALVKVVTDELPRRAARLTVAGTLLEIRGHAVLIDGRLQTLAPSRDGDTRRARGPAGRGRAQGPPRRLPAAGQRRARRRRRDRPAAHRARLRRPHRDGHQTRLPPPRRRGGDMSLPVLLAVAHGTRSAAGQAQIRDLVDRVACRRPDVDVRLAFADVQHPRVGEAIQGPDTVVVPLLLSSGYHVRVDIAEAVAERRRGRHRPARPGSRAGREPAAAPR
nr:hypothetical protein GCM10020092_059510 [Actinoplanes digitatis]